MRRREFIALVGCGAAAWPLAARGQREGRVRRVGMLLAAYTETDSAGQLRITAFRGELHRLGWTDEAMFGSKLAGAMEIATAGRLWQKKWCGRGRMRSSFRASGVGRLHRLTRTIPIVFTQVSDPVDSGFVSSLARPGGNITGFQNFEPDIGGKWLGVLREIAPQLRRVGVLVELRRRSPRSIRALRRSSRAVTWRGLDGDEREESRRN